MNHTFTRTPAPAEAHTAARACEEVCGQRPGDRRVRVQRPPRTVGRRVAALARRLFADR